MEDTTNIMVASVNTKFYYCHTRYYFAVHLYPVLGGISINRLASSKNNNDPQNKKLPCLYLSHVHHFLGLSAIWVHLPLLLVNGFF